jgi:superfamily II DNA or RNA helicase
LSVTGAKCPNLFAYRGNKVLFIMTGALLSMLKEGLLDFEVPPSLLPERERSWRKHLEILQQVGLLRDYQAEAVFSALAAPLGRSIIEVGTGGGKTHICAGIIAVSRMHWIYLVPNAALARQTQRKFDELIYKMHKALTDSKFAYNLQGWREGNEIAPVRSSGAYPIGTAVCTSIEMAPAAELARAAGMMGDECHRFGMTSAWPLFDYLQAGWRVGLSGTPLDRQDERNSLVVGLFGPVLCQVKIDRLMEEGHLAPGKVVPVVFDSSKGRLIR